MSDLNPDLPEIEFDIQITEVKAKARKLSMTWSQDAADDLADMFYRFGPGDWVWNTETGGVGTILTRERVEDPEEGGSEIVYEVEDMMTGRVERFGEGELEGPLNEMEVLARVRNMS